MRARAQTIPDPWLRRRPGGGSSGIAGGGCARLEVQPCCDEPSPGAAPPDPGSRSLPTALTTFGSPCCGSSVRTAKNTTWASAAGHSAPARPCVRITPAAKRNSEASEATDARMPQQRKRVGHAEVGPSKQHDQESSPNRALRGSDPGALGRDLAAMARTSRDRGGRHGRHAQVGHREAAGETSLEFGRRRMSRAPTARPRYRSVTSRPIALSKNTP
jgi:hypothetical protein